MGRWGTRVKCKIYTVSFKLWKIWIVFNFKKGGGGVEGDGRKLTAQPNILSREFVRVSDLMWGSPTGSLGQASSCGTKWAPWRARAVSPGKARPLHAHLTWDWQKRGGWLSFCNLGVFWLLQCIFMQNLDLAEFNLKDLENTFSYGQHTCCR